MHLFQKVQPRNVRKLLPQLVADPGWDALALADELSDEPARGVIVTACRHSREVPEADARDAKATGAAPVPSLVRRAFGGTVPLS